ncbi:unnamed protein product [Arabidopsis thaliana]|uniref:(thale cress) hypothetical protein n=1 Tax=Arabidopsis thaliana TaxID=3702 RepID=A0A7G2EKN9_ARATH|nr:unnamed protein product [Arabidopsis thaliana]
MPMFHHSPLPSNLHHLPQQLVVVSIDLQDYQWS